MSPTDIFPNEDITLISTVDSADFARFGLQPEDIMNFVFKLQKDKGLQRNKMALGLATNKLLLAFKNKPGFLEELVMTSQPSLLNIFQNINRIAERENLKFDERVAQGKAFDRWGRLQNKPYASPEEMAANQKEYIQKQKDSDKVYYDDGIIVQYGGGSMFKPGSYDRYTPFKNYPKADFLVIAWPMGLVQASCNPFKGERELKGVNLGEIAQEVLSKWESKLKDKVIPLSTIKWISESSKSFDEDSVGFTNADLEAFYGDKIRSIDGGEEYMDRLKNIMNKPNNELTDTEWEILDKLGVPAWEMIQANSGGHKCITNISALNYFGRSKRPPNPNAPRRQNMEGDSPSVQFIKMIQKRFVEILKEKINQSKEKINESSDTLRKNLEKLPSITIKDKDGIKNGIDELNSGGEITNEMSNIATKFFEGLVNNVPNLGTIRLTAGNDEYHQTKNNNSLHRVGKAIDFTITNHSKELLNYLEKFKKENPGFDYIDEYSKKSTNWTGEHIHISYDIGSDIRSTNKVKTNISKNPTLRIGSKGKDVVSLQNKLMSLGYELPKYGADGGYGKETESAVKELQKDLVKDGIDIGNTGPKRDGVDGAFGPKTNAGMKQKFNI
jgi:hypothetical protein